MSFMLCQYLQKCLINVKEKKQHWLKKQFLPSNIHYKVFQLIVEKPAHDLGFNYLYIDVSI